MKKIFKISFIALAMFATACAEIEEPDKPQDPGTTETPETPEEPGDTPEDGTIVFTANVPVKTAIDADDVKVTWVDGDQVKFIWAGGEYVAAAKGSGATTTFEVPVEEGITELYAVYPSTMAAEIVDGKLVLDFVNTLENGTFAANDVTVSRALKAEEWNTTLNFKNAASLFKVGVDKAETKRLEVVSCGEEIIAGALTLAFAENGELTYEYPAEGKTSVSMAISAPGNYYIPVFPGVTMESGFRINRFEGEGENETEGTPFYYKPEFTTERGAIYRYPNFETNAGHYYVATQKQGTGAAHKASEAMDVDSFIELVTTKENHTLLRGATFHFAAEEFSFGDDYLVLNYSELPIVNLTFEGSGSGDNMTVFKGRENTTDSNKAGVIWPQSNTDLTVRNVKFTGVKGASNAAVVRINSGAQKVTFEDCVFDGNETVKVDDDGTTSVGTGACLALYNDAELIVKGCTFTGNAGCGAAVVVNHEDAKVRIENSVIKECSQKSNAIYIQKCAQFEIVDSEISDNYSYATVYAVTAFAGSFRAERTLWKNNHAYDDYGPAGWYESTATFNFKDCQFIDNMADWGGGALMFVKAHAVIDGCTFQGNHADGDSDSAAAGGAIYAKGEGVIVDCKNSLFKENYNLVGENTKSGGIIRVQQSGGIARFDNCMFDGNYTNRSKQDNAAAAAIINCRQGGAKYYFNACEFKHNASGTTETSQGGTKGVVMATYASSTIAMNNCSMHDNYGSRNPNEPEIQWIYLDNASNTFILSNSSIIGDPTRKVGDQITVLDHWSVIKLHSAGNYHFINNIICSNYKDGNCFWIEKSALNDSGKLPVTSYYNKTSPEGDNRTNWGDDTGSGHDYYATTDYFSSWATPHLWDGTLLKGTNNTSFAPTDGVNTKIQEADSDFYSWLSEIGALGKDIKGKDRGTTSWPGCYQN